MPARMQLDFTFRNPGQRSHRPNDETPFRMLVLGDFAGRRPRDGFRPAEIDARPIFTVDVDDFEQAMARLVPAVRQAACGHAPIEFRNLDDFHPDRLYRDLDVFGALREIRARLLDPATFADAAARLHPGAADRHSPVRSADSVAAGGDDDDALLSRLLGAKAAAAPSPPSPNTGLPRAVEALIRQAVAPHVVAEAPRFQAQYVASVDEAAAKLMRAILHDDAFRAVEAAWRSLRWLVAELELGERPTLHVLDLSREELQADLAAAGDDLEQSRLYRRLVEETARGVDAPQWSLLVGLYTFARSIEDAGLLARLGAVASQLQAPFLGAADSSLAGCRSLADTPDPRDWSLTADPAEEHWRSLRTSATARWIGLALPRPLLRLPYGAKTDRIDSFEFEEQSAAGDHAAYLWGHPAIACALLIGQSFLQDGWQMTPGDRLDIGDLPAHIVERNGERSMQACAELFLSERAGEALLERGLMPLMSFRNRNAARILRMQSIALPAAALCGRWAQSVP